MTPRSHISRVGSFKLFRHPDGTRTLTLRRDGLSLDAPKLPRWVCFFVGRHGASHTNWTYRPVSR